LYCWAEGSKQATFSLIQERSYFSLIHSEGCIVELPMKELQVSFGSHFQNNYHFAVHHLVGTRNLVPYFRGNRGSHRFYHKKLLAQPYVRTVTVMYIFTLKIVLNDFRCHPDVICCWTNFSKA
jgi:hypothetical protein